MKRIWIPGVLVVVALGLGVSAREALQYVLVSCTADQCHYLVATSVTFAGKTAVRVTRPPLESVTPAALGKMPEVKIETIAGLTRDASNQVLYRLGPDGARQELALPIKLTGTAPVPPGQAWAGATLEYLQAGAKAKATMPIDGLAYVLVSADAEQAVFQFLQRLIAPSETDPRRPQLIRGAVQFNAKSPTLQTWKESLIGGIRAQILRFDEQTGDPSTLADSLREAVRLKAVYVQVADNTANKELLEHVAVADALFNQRLAIADALRDAALWDDYLVKIRQMGLARWSMPDALPRMREALTQSTSLHHDRSVAFTAEKHYDRAFDEAALAARNSCDKDVLRSFYDARIKHVNRNMIPAAAEYTSNQKVVLDQIVRELDQLDPNKEQVTLERIRQGEVTDPDFLPLQWKKAEFLAKLGRYTEALAVLERIERNVPLDPKELNLSLTLDGTITNNLADAVQKSRDEARKAFDEGRYQDALTAAAKGLKAGPNDADLLYFSAMSAAFLRQTPSATAFIRNYLADANMTCARPEDPAKILDLYRTVLGPVSRPAAADGIPNWISGTKYQLLDAFYDPISLGFLQPITRISSIEDGVTTVFRREPGSFLVNLIVTSKANPKASATSTGAETVTFDAEPRYDLTTLSMTEIGPRSLSTSVPRPVMRPTYLNSPTLDLGLVLKFTGRQVARGWAGNPFFLPFVWNRLYYFDLTYDDKGRIVTATPIAQDAGARPDPFSEPLEFTWVGDTKQLQSVRGKTSGYTRTLEYAKTGHLLSEKITTSSGGKGSVEYEYYSNSAQLKGAKYSDNFWDKRERVIYFDWDPSKGH